MSRTFRVLAVVASAAMIMGALVAGPAEAKKKKKKKPAPVVATCPAFAPVEPQTEASDGAKALEAEVQTVTDEHTEEAPLTIEYEHGQAFYEEHLMEDNAYFNFQVDTSLPQTGLHIRQEWSGLDDMDLYLYDATGAEVDSSGAFNPAPVDGGYVDFSSDGKGGMGYESIPGFAAADCAGFTVESRAYASDGANMTLKVWLGEPQAAEEQP